METKKKIRLGLLMQVVYETSILSGDSQFENWYREKNKLFKSQNDDEMEELYNEIDEFVKTNNDLIMLFFTAKNQYNGFSIKPLKVECVNC